MNWRLCLAVFINVFFICFPYNILGCGGEIDPYDYYTSFFRNDISDVPGYKPFYYTSYEFLYEDTEPQSTAEATSAEWIGYCGNNATKSEAYDFVCRYTHKDLSNLYSHVEKNQALSLPDSVKANKITQYFLNSKDLEALGYLMYAKQVEPHVNAKWDAWDPPARDSGRMSRLQKNGQQLYNAAKKDFIKLRYAYQVVRLAHYNSYYEDCIRLYDELIVPNKTESVLQPLSVSLKAGALFRLDKKEEAAYLFSEQFSKSNLKRVSNYLSFAWCVKRLDEDNRLACLKRCKTNEEKANMLALFALGSPEYEIAALKEIFKLHPSASVLEILSSREINKVEEGYLSPMLAAQPGGKKLIYGWYYEKMADSTSQKWKQRISELADFFQTVAQNKSTKNKALYEVGGAYLFYISQNYIKAKEYLSAVEKMQPSAKVKDQARLVQLLVTVNEQKNIDAAFETKLLPSLQWLEAKARADKKKETDYGYGISQWQLFYRNLMSEILAKQYHQQGDIRKEALSLGKSALFGESYVYSAKNFVRHDMETKDILALNELLGSTKKTAFDAYLANAFLMTKDEVTDMIATTHLRDYNFGIALEWLAKIKDSSVLALHRNPFAALLKDNQEEIFGFDKGSFNKKSFAREMKTLLDKEKQSKANTADYYKLANGFYNMTYYGRAWQAVEYERSGTDGYSIPKNATAFQREYYGCFTAEKYFEKAMHASTDKNFKAKCLFMMAKCSQKQVQMPGRYYYGYSTDEEANKAFTQFMHNKHFPALVKDYGTTPFYKEAYNTCSYLKDFVLRKQ